MSSCGYYLYCILEKMHYFLFLPKIPLSRMYVIGLLPSFQENLSKLKLVSVPPRKIVRGRVLSGGHFPPLFMFLFQ